MRLEAFLNEDLTAQRSGYSWSGIVYRATDSKNKQAVLGRGMYFTPEEGSAKGYGKNIKKYQVKLKKVLGYNSREWNDIKQKASYAHLYRLNLEGSLIDVITKFVKDAGYDSVYGGNVLGLCLLYPKNQIQKEIK